MARKPPISYASLDGSGDVPPDNKAIAPPATRSTGRGAQTLKEASAHIMTYVHPDAAKALKRYAVENNCKVHDLCLEAFEEWFRAHGLQEKVRADPRKLQLS